MSQDRDHGSALRKQDDGMLKAEALRRLIREKADEVLNNTNRHARRALTTQARLAQKRHEKHQKLRSSHGR